MNTWRGQQQNGSKSIPMETGILHGPDVRRGSEMLGQACQVESPFPRIPLVQDIFWMDDILTTDEQSKGYGNTAYHWCFVEYKSSYNDLHLELWQPGPPWHLVWCRYPRGSSRSDQWKKEAPCGISPLLFLAPREMGPSLHQTARTGHLPEIKIMCEFVWSWPSIANHKALVTTEAQHTSTSGESGTVWINLVTVWMNESIWRFLRSLNATSFNSSSIYYWWQITISLCGQWLHTTTGLRDMITLLFIIMFYGYVTKSGISPAFWADCSETGFLPLSVGWAPLL